MFQSINKYSPSNSLKLLKLRFPQFYLFVYVLSSIQFCHLCRLHHHDKDTEQFLTTKLAYVALL